MPPFGRVTTWTTKPPLAACRIAPVWAAGMVGCWALAEGAGTRSANLLTPTYNDATIHNAPTWAMGPYGQSLATASASTQYLDCGQVTQLNGASQATIFVAGNRATGKLWVAGRNAATTVVQVLFYTDNNAYLSVATGTVGAYNTMSAPTGNFTFAMIYDGTQSSASDGFARVRGYLNGVAQTLTSGGANTIPATIPTSTNTWQIGADVGQSRYSDGRYDVCYLWVGRVLSAGEIALLHGNPSCIFEPAMGARLLPNMAPPAPGSAYWRQSVNRPWSRPITGPAVTTVYG